MPSTTREVLGYAAGFAAGFAIVAFTIGNLTFLFAHVVNDYGIIAAALSGILGVATYHLVARSVASRRASKGSWIVALSLAYAGIFTVRLLIATELLSFLASIVLAATLTFIGGLALELRSSRGDV